MEEQKINRSEMLSQFEKELKEAEKSSATIDKYMRDAARFVEFIGESGAVTKDAVISYKQHLAKSYAVISANSMLAAVNSFLRTIGCGDCVVRFFKVQSTTFRARERELNREEYTRLVEAAKKNGKKCLSLIMQTICATGIRISELQFITVQALHIRKATVSLKGKTRIVILPVELCVELKRYTREKKITSGSIFVTRTGRPIDRSNILHGMKALCEEAKVLKSKVSPHNLRHLFALTYYKVEKDICHLADLLGHSSINTTRIYTMVSCEEQEQQIDCLGLFIGT